MDYRLGETKDTVVSNKLSLIEEREMHADNAAEERGEDVGSEEYARMRNETK